jgi:hypothetical protein
MIYCSRLACQPGTIQYVVPPTLHSFQPSILELGCHAQPGPHTSTLPALMDPSTQSTPSHRRSAWPAQTKAIHSSAYSWSVKHCARLECPRILRSGARELGLSSPPLALVCLRYCFCYRFARACSSLHGTIGCGSSVRWRGRRRRRCLGCLL